MAKNRLIQLGCLVLVLYLLTLFEYHTPIKFIALAVSVISVTVWLSLYAYKINKYILWIVVASSLIGIYIYFQRPTLVDSCEFNDSCYEIYQDWKYSTAYDLPKNERWTADNYYILKRDTHPYMRFKYLSKYEWEILPHWFNDAKEQSLYLSIERNTTTYYMKIMGNGDKEISQNQINVYRIDSCLLTLMPQTFVDSLIVLY